MCQLDFYTKTGGKLSGCADPHIRKGGLDSCGTQSPIVADVDVLFPQHFALIDDSWLCNDFMEEMLDLGRSASLGLWESSGVVFRDKKLFFLLLRLSLSLRLSVLGLHVICVFSKLMTRLYACRIVHKNHALYKSATYCPDASQSSFPGHTDIANGYSYSTNGGPRSILFVILSTRPLPSL